MKLLVAIVRPFKLGQIVEALAHNGVQGLTVTEVKGCGRQKGHTQVCRGAEYTALFLPMLKIELAAPSHQVEQVTAAIVGAVKTGHIGDSKVFVLRLDQSVNVRTGETDKTASSLAA